MEVASPQHCHILLEASYLKGGKYQFMNTRRWGPSGAILEVPTTALMVV